MFDEALVERKIRKIQNAAETAKTITNEAAISKGSRAKENIQDVITFLDKTLAELAELKKYLEEV